MANPPTGNQANTSPDFPRLFLISTAVAAFVVAIVTTILFVAWQSQSGPEVPENLVFGAAIGTVVGVLVTALWLASFPLLRWGMRKTRRPIRAVAATTIVILGVVGSMGALAAWKNQPMIAFVVLAAPGTLVAAALIARGAASASPIRPALVIVVIEAAVIAAITLISPIHPRPQIVRFVDARPDDLVVMSWNCGLGNPHATPSRREDLPAIARTITQSNAHVVCLQEVGDENRDALLALLGGSWQGVSNEPNNGWADSVITRLPARLETLVLPQLYRGTAAAHIEYAGQSLELLSVHLSPGAASDRRHEQVASLRGYARSARAPVLVAGDMNLDPSCVWDRWLPFFTDAVQRDFDVQGMLWDIGLDAGEGCSSTATLSRRIDRILVPSRWKTVEFRVLYGEKIGRRIQI